MPECAFLRLEVVPRREAVLAIAQEIEELNNANLDAQRAEVARRHAAFNSDLHRLIWQSVLLGLAVALGAVFRLRVLERRSDEQRERAQESERQMRQLSQQLVAAQEEERKHLSRELHDHVAQVLTALRMELGRIERTRPPGETPRRRGCRRIEAARRRPVPDRARPRARAADRACWTTSASRPRWSGTCATSPRVTVLNVELDIDGNLDAFPDAHRLCVYRAVQEALTNCIRHARARGPHQPCRRCGSDRLEVNVTDDGVGLTSGRRPDGLGLRGIEERVKELARHDADRNRTRARHESARSHSPAAHAARKDATCECCWLTITASSAAGCEACSKTRTSR